MESRYQPISLDCTGVNLRRILSIMWYNVTSRYTSWSNEHSGFFLVLLQACAKFELPCWQLDACNWRSSTVSSLTYLPYLLCEMVNLSWILALDLTPFLLDIVNGFWPSSSCYHLQLLALPVSVNTPVLLKDVYPLRRWLKSIWRCYFIQVRNAESSFMFL